MAGRDGAAAAARIRAAAPSAPPKRSTEVEASSLLRRTRAPTGLRRRRALRTSSKRPPRRPSGTRRRRPPARRAARRRQRRTTNWQHSFSHIRRSAHSDNQPGGGPRRHSSPSAGLASSACTMRLESLRVSLYASLSALFLTGVASAGPSATLANVFGDHMVLQREAPCLW